jgi:hypothetical protein
VSEANVEYEVGTVLAVFPYDADLIERLKTEIPVHARAWVPDRKGWRFNDSYWDEASRIIEEFFPIVD